MTDVLDRQKRDGAAALCYPLGTPPGRGQIKEVVPGVRWIRMSLPLLIDHINLWVLDDGAGWAVVDTGIRNDETLQRWREFLSLDGFDRPLTRVLVTHLHPDHVGMAGWLTRRFAVRLWMSRPEYLMCRVMASDSGREAPPDGKAFYRRAGWSEQAVETYRARFGNFGTHIHALPDSYRKLSDGENLRIGTHEWRVVTGEGHSPEHVCLYCPELKVLISGDQVLPRISSNVSVYPTEPDADPLKGWLASLEKLRREVADDVLVLPSHNECFYGLHARLDALNNHQHQALERLRKRLTSPHRVVDVFDALFGRAVDESSVARYGMATGESIAFLNHLIHRGEVTSETDTDGVAWYRNIRA